MKHDEELVDRVAKALANASGTYHFTARAVLDALAADLRHDPPEGLAEALYVEAAGPTDMPWDRMLPEQQKPWRQRAASIAARVPALADPPEGCEAVWLPTEVVDRYGDRYEGPIGHACREAQARRPKPERKTVRVPAIEALGREVVSDEGSNHPTFVGYSISGKNGKLVIQSYSGRSQQRIGPDGKVEVLAEDDQ